MVEIVIKEKRLVISRTLPIKVNTPKKREYGFVKVRCRKKNFTLGEARYKFEPNEESRKNRAEFWQTSY